MSADQAALVDRVVDAVTAVPGVAGIYAGGAGSIATYLPGRTVGGVRLGDESGEVHIVVEFHGDTDLIEVAERAQRAASAAAGVPVNVIVADIALPSEQSKEITA